jgi:hypothetical protein
MHIFRVLLEAGPSHEDYSAGTTLHGVCMVDSIATDEAKYRASSRFFSLGWASVTFEEAVWLPSEPDISNFNSVMTEAFHDAKRIGVSLILYPDQASTG